MHVYFLKSPKVTCVHVRSLCVYLKTKLIVESCLNRYAKSCSISKMESKSALKLIFKRFMYSSSFDSFGHFDGLTQTWPF